MTKVNVLLKPVKPVKQDILTVNLTMTEEEARTVRDLLGRATGKQSTSTYELWNELDRALYTYDHS